jgi:tRNA(Ile2) C34 agmatinyltransferase TiaS
MEMIICIDDTDNLDSPGTGHLAEILRKNIEELTGGTTTRITRHQLFVSPEIPYTSHNSAMCFIADVAPEFYDRVIAMTQNFLETNSAPGSDPGFCAAVRERISEPERLMAFGRSALNTVLTKKEAYALADDLKIHLSEHGGTGGGVIGALAGTGLRLDGNNGRFKGWLEITDEDRQSTASALMSKYDIDRVQTAEGRGVSGDEKIILFEKVKTVLLGGQSVLVVKPYTEDSGMWTNLSRLEVKRY